MVRGFLKNKQLCFGSRQALRPEEQIVHVSIAGAASEQRFEIAVDGFDHPSIPSSGSSSRCPPDDPATCGLVSPSVSVAASVTGQSSFAGSATWPLRRCNSTTARGS